MTQRKAGKAVLAGMVAVLAQRGLHKADCHAMEHISTAEASWLAWFEILVLSS